MRYENVIVFGPTGAVGGAVALEASKRGAKVWLAMRDTNKVIHGISDQQIQEGKFTCVKADLSDSETVKQAVQLSGAKAAFVYLRGDFKSAVQAMKDTGVEYIVFLSSFTIEQNTPIREVPQDALIPYMHAQGEVALEDIGIAHVALRPASFASNLFRINMDDSKTPNELYLFTGGNRQVDNIVQEDIGRVGGAVLVDRPSTSSKEVIYLYGPTVRSELEAAKVIKALCPREVKIVQQTPEEWAARVKARGMPAPFVDYMLKAQKSLESEGSERYFGEIAKQGAANIKKYSGYEPTSFEDFVRSQYSG